LRLTLRFRHIIAIYHNNLLKAIIFNSDHDNNRNNKITTF